MAYQPTLEEMEDKRIVRGLEYDEGEWTGLYFQPLLLCKHRREQLIAHGWVLEESSELFPEHRLYWSGKFIPAQHCNVIDDQHSAPTRAGSTAAGATRAQTTRGA